VYPDSYFSSINALFDRCFGTGCEVRGRRVLVTGRRSALAIGLVDLLRGAGAAEVTVVATAGGLDAEALSVVDILVLCPEEAELTPEAWVPAIERFKAAARGRRFPVEVWAVAGEAELLGGARAGVARVFARNARRYYSDEQIYYRHVVVSEAALAAVGPKSRATARWVWFFVRRGFRYVPASYSGMAALNFFRFRALRPLSASGGLS
jgi:hypothetical protein